MRIISNTSKLYPCVMCGTPGNIVREAQNLEATRIKCNNPTCGLVYSAADSSAMKEAGEIPDAPPELQDQAVTQPEEDRGEDAPKLEATSDSSGGRSVQGAARKTFVPTKPAYVIVARDRKEVEFCTTAQFKKTLLQWEAAGKKYDVFALTSKKVSAKVDIS